LPRLRLEQLEFASYLAYTPRPQDAAGRFAKDFTLTMKDGKAAGTPPTSIPTQIADHLRNEWASLVIFKPFLDPTTVLVPVPRSSIRGKGDLWVPEQIAKELVRVGLGRRVAPLLVRTETIPKAARSVASERPTASDHYRTMAVQRDLGEVAKITLVDDVVTTGGTCLGSANRLVEEYPDAPIRAFAVVRTQSIPATFQRLNDPVAGTITLQQNGWCLRRP